MAGEASCAWPTNQWNSNLQSNPFEFSVTFTTAGTFSYFCMLHCGLGMTEEIVVQGPAETPTPTSTATAVVPTSTTTLLPATATPTVSTATATPNPVPGAVPTLSPSMLALFVLALARAAAILIKRS